jgi:FkbM family methyltransferase
VIATLHRLGTRARHSRVGRRLQPLWLSLEPLWDRMLEAASRERGYVAHVNGDSLRLTYRYGARYEKIGYEPLVHELFTTGIESGMVVFDVGAHVGLFALAAALRVGPTGRVYAFEPAPVTAALLERHVRMNGLENSIEVVRVIVADAAGELDFYTQGATMAAALFPENIEVLSPERGEGRLEVSRTATTTIDGFCAERSIRPDRIKIDVEGAELSVLRGAGAALESDAEILCEVHPQAIAFMSGTVDEVEELLMTNNRRVERVGDPNPLGIYHLRSSRPTS